MRALITGGSGFIGTAVTQRLSKKNFDVTIFDKRPPCDKSIKSCKYIEGDLLDLEKVKASIVDVDIVYHFAANADISMGFQNTSLDLQMTTMSTYNVLEAMRVNDIRSILFLSGSGVYGNIGNKIAREDSGPLLPVSLYGASKLAAEGLISAFASMFNMHATILRPANIVGGGQTHGVLFDFVRKLKRDHQRLEVLGNGQQKKSYLHIDDLVEAIEVALTNQNESVRLVNVASADLIDVNCIAQTVIDFLNLKDVSLAYTGGIVGWIGDVPTIRMDTSKLRELGWKPQLTSKAAIQKALAEMTSEKVV
jgi:UDP-glucose 4-epimerase